MLLICNWRYATVVREQGASRPCIPTRGGEVLLLRGWAFLLRVAHSVPMERLGRAGCRLFAESEVCGRRARAGSVAPLHPHEGRRGSFAARLDVFLKVERSVPMERLGRAGCRLFAESEVCGHRARAGSVVPLHPLKRQRDSFAARLDVSIEGRACWFAFDELDVARLRNRRCATIARGRGASLPCIPSRGGEVLSLHGCAFLLRVECWLFAESEVSAIARRRGASLPCIPSRGGEVLLLRGWAFLLRVGRVGSLMTSWMLLVYGIGGARLSREGGERRSPASPSRGGGVLLLRG